MFFNQKKAIILVVAVLIVFLLAGAALRGNYQFPLMEKMITGIFSPIEYGFTKVGTSIQQSSSFIAQIFHVYKDNQMLLAENEQLKQNNIGMVEIQAENERLRAMLEYKKSAPQFDFMAAAVIARDPGSWTSSIIINRGAKDGLVKDMPVVTAHGLVGTVSKVFNSTAQVQLILDPRSAVGGLVQRLESRVAGIVTGNTANPLTPRMINIARDADVLNGDKLITSGFGGLYPKGLPIGEVIDVVNEEGGLLKYAVLKPAVDFDRLEEVFVIAVSREPLPTLPLPSAQQQNTDIKKGTRQ